uniref:protein NLP7-like n=1 Tax=Erigeron canadensis TaxID=72917 RepID=UPI001CB91F6B|nr:protein NLP7-like [Erigeron canadensis]
MKNNLCLEPPTRPFSGESRYLTSLWVSESGGESREKQQQAASPSVDSPLSSISRSGRTAENGVLHNQKIVGTIKSALKHLSFREQRVLVQFWSPHVIPIRKHLILLTTIDQPFGLGVKDDQGLISYRKHSERKPFLVDKNHHEEDRSPPARVFRRELPEWTSDILTDYNPEQFPLHDHAISCNLHGYLALPVFDSTTRLCVGVLELLMSSKYTSFAYEVQQFHMALKNSDLRTPQAFDCPTFNVHNEHKQIESKKVFSILEDVCRLQRLPLAQTWIVSPPNTFVSHKKILMKSCNSFDTTCFGEVCMSNAALPFYIQDMGMWPFRKACRERHLDKSQGVVGRALSSRGTSFCGDVTKLSAEEYPLVHNARISGLTGCFAIFLHSVESNNNYVLEFFLELGMHDHTCLSNMLQTLKHKIEVASIFVLGDTSSIQVIGPAMEVSDQSLNIDPHDNSIFSTATTNTKIFEMVSSDSESIVADVANTNVVNVPNQLTTIQNQPNKFGITSTNTENLVGNEIIKDKVDVVKPGEGMQKTNNTITHAGGKSNRLKQGRKRKMDTLTMEAVKQHHGETIGQAAKSLKVSRSTLKRFCRTHNMPNWPPPKYNKTSRFGISFLVFLLTKVKRWSCSSQRHGFSGKWWSCGKHRLIPCKSYSIYQVTCLMVYWKRWRNKIPIRHAMQKKDQPAVCESTSKPEYTVTNPCLHAGWQLTESSLVLASPKQTNVSDTKKVTVKATLKDDMIKFPFPALSGLMELKNEVARRFRLKSTTFRLKYEDEDNDLILLACDADLHTLTGFPSSKSTIKLIILADD